MKRLALALAVVALVLAGLDALADATQNRPDQVGADSSSTLTLAVRHADGPAGLVEAQALWAVCNRSARSVRLTAPVQPLGDGRFRLALQPALGEHARRRVVGCLEDTTLDGLLGRVAALEHRVG